VTAFSVMGPVLDRQLGCARPGGQTEAGGVAPRWLEPLLIAWSVGPARDHLRYQSERTRRDGEGIHDAAGFVGPSYVDERANRPQRAGEEGLLVPLKRKRSGPAPSSAEMASILVDIRGPFRGRIRHR
jgi:hypothetical protein